MRRSPLTIVRLVLVALCLLTFSGAAFALIDIPEIEPNENKAGATQATLGCGDSVSGTTIGSSTGVPGAASADYFRITGPASTGSLTRFTMTLSSTTPGHISTIRGLTQTNRVINVGTDTALQGSVIVGTDRINRWYGLGNGLAGQIYYSVTGSAATTAPYTSVLTCDPVIITPISGIVAAGPVTVRPDATTDAAVDTDFWVYDGNFNIIPTFGHDDADATGTTRTLGAGTYYIAFGPYNIATNQPAPADDTFTGANVIDFPNVVVQGSASALTTPAITVQVVSNGATHSATAMRTSAFEIMWFTFTIGSPTLPIGTGSALPNPVAQGASTTLRVTVSPAPGSSLDNVTSVTANIAALSGNPPDTSVAFTRTPATADWTYTVPIVNGAPGTANIAFTITDPQSSGGNGAGSFPVTVTATLGACCNAANCTLTNGPLPCIAGGGTFVGYNSVCGGGPLPDNRNTVAVAIPDYVGPAPTVPTPVSTSINIAQATTINDLDVYVKINHPWGGDVYLRLRGPNGTIIDLYKRAGAAAPCTPGVIGNGNDLDGTYIFDDDAATTLHAATIAGPSPIAAIRYIPSTCAGVITSLDSAAGFGGLSTAGNWTLLASDEDEGITGTVQEFGLVINGVQQLTPCGETGACCCGSTCSLTTAASCAGTNQAFVGSGTACNPLGNTTAPCCRADYNHSGAATGQTTVQDVFDFLTGFFANDPCADVDGSGGANPISVQDVFDYLSLFFAAASGGC